MTRVTLQSLIPELQQLEYLIELADDCARVNILNHVPYDDNLLPIYSLEMGAKQDDVPAIAFVGGVHGLERIGTAVVLSLLETLISRMSWDSTLHLLLEKIRILFIPLLNPAGMAKKLRSNPNHIDLMRNAPVDSQEKTAWLVGGHRIASFLPWYRGPSNQPMQIESQALVDCIQNRLLCSPFSLSLDCHSGFGAHDRIWFPYAKSRQKPIRHIGEIYHLREIFFQTYPHQNYLFEPQARHYICHGDLWDYLYDQSLQSPATFLPLTLEMGSWRWVRKNPLQLMNALGPYHPVKPHRTRRVLRTHLVLMEFLMKAAASYQRWTTDAKSLNMAQRGRALWYE